jgi:cytochrome c-type biogenesis protein CcmH/NrfF
MGAMHPFEQLLTLLLAFGPFLILGAVIWWRRHTEQTEDQADR